MTWARSWPVFAQSFDTPLSIFMLSLRTLLRTLSCVLKKPVLLRTTLRTIFCALKKRLFCCQLLVVALLWSKIDSLHSTRAREATLFYRGAESVLSRLFILRNVFSYFVLPKKRACMSIFNH